MKLTWEKLFEGIELPKRHFLHIYRLNIGIVKINKFMKTYLCYKFNDFSLWTIGNEIYLDCLSQSTGIHHLNEEQLLLVLTSIHNLTAKPELCRQCFYKPLKHNV